MERGEEARTVEAPPELKKGIDEKQEAQQRRDDLAFTHKQELGDFHSRREARRNPEAATAEVMQVLKTGENGTG